MTKQQGGTLLWRSEQLMRIPCDGVGELDAIQEAAVRLGDECTAAPCGIHVEPQPVLSADLGDLPKGVERTYYGSTRGGGHHERRGALLDGSGDLHLQIGDHHLATGIDLDQIYVVIADAQERGELLHGIVRVLRREHHQPRHLR